MKVRMRGAIPKGEAFVRTSSLTLGMFSFYMRAESFTGKEGEVHDPMRWIVRIGGPGYSSRPRSYGLSTEITWGEFRASSMGGLYLQRAR
jgi:hypothetical protein